MAYLRFLTDNDYISLVTEEHWKQLIRDKHDRIIQAEQRAEMNMLEYLDQYYEIEGVLAMGKGIREHNVAVSYPSQIWLQKDGEIYRTLTALNGYKKPTKIVYWKKMVDFVDPNIMEAAKKYSQLRMYAKGEVVIFGTEYWQCLIPHGYESNEIHIPGAMAWQEVEVSPWEPMLSWKKDNVCSFNGNFYQYLPESTPVDEETALNPEEDDSWGMIGEYSSDLEYDYSEGVFDYVVCEGSVFYPIMNPNADAFEEGVNVMKDDPRNVNVVAHMSRIALYYLHQLISPTNISETRKWAYEESMLWLYNASKFKINPQLPRKREQDTGNTRVDWALATFQKSYDPNENSWLI